ncbi:MAG: hypothetical protein LBR70_00380 [Lactobacillaceae bacterium]|jgi:hypothetical protein|nr:hypothetical protein [Lactobacillaceae bacterium]
MRKLFIAFMIIALSATSVYARPYNNNHYKSRPNYNRPIHNTTVIKKSGSGERIALGVVTGLFGLAAINSIVSSRQPAATVQYVSPAPAYVNAPAYVAGSPSSQNCITTMDRYSGATTTTCTSAPQVREIVYVR